VNKEQEQIINEAYETYNKEIIRQREIQKEEVNRLRSQGKRVRVSLIELLTKEQFINKCKTDPEFSEKWGLKIGERELSRKERSDYYYKHGNSEGIVEGSLDLPIWVNDETAHVWYDKRNVPTQQITVTYKDTIIESYE
jgi:hypothetical protein